MSIKYSDSGFLDGADETKKLSFDVSGVTTGTTRTITMPDGDTKLYTGDGTSGQVLTSGGTGVAPTFQAAAGGGITEADLWRLTTSFLGNGFITTNLERSDTDGFGLLGTGMSHSSGAFAFPSTGYWLVSAYGRFRYTGVDRALGLQTYYTSDNSSYAQVDETYSNLMGNGSNTHLQTSNQTILDITNTTNQKLKFNANNGASATTVGGTNGNVTYFTFIKLGDT